MRAATYTTASQTAVVFFERRRADSALLWECPCCHEGLFQPASTLLPQAWHCDCCDADWARRESTSTSTGGIDRDPEIDLEDHGYGDDAVMEMDEEE